MNGTNLNIEIAAYDYCNGMTLKQVGEKHGFKDNTILYHFRKNGIKTRNRSECQFGKKRPYLSKERNPNWKGGKSITCGYVKLNSNEREHRAIAENILGRKLKRHEVVHHIDGDGTNNLNSNLIICTQAYHMFLHKLINERKNK